MSKDKITIYVGSRAIELPKARYSISGEEVSKKVPMSSGKIVKDIIGFRKQINVEYDWMPADTLTELVAALRTGAFFDVEYQDVNGMIKREPFEISNPEPRVFKFSADGVARWHTVKLKMTAQEVT